MVVRAFASHQCGLASILAHCQMSLLSVLSLPWGVLRVLWFFHAPQKPMSLKSNSSRTENLHENYDCCEIEMKVKTVVASSLNVMFFFKKKRWLFLLVASHFLPPWYIAWFCHKTNRRLKEKKKNWQSRQKNLDPYPTPLSSRYTFTTGRLLCLICSNTVCC